MRSCHSRPAPSRWPARIFEAPVARGDATETALGAAPEEIARGFLDAYGDYDAERAMTYLTDDAIASIAFTPEELALTLAMMEAHRWKQTITGCEQQGDSPDGVTIRCTFDLHLLGSDQLGLGPYSDNYWDLTIRDGRIVVHVAWSSRSTPTESPRCSTPSPSGSPPSTPTTSTPCSRRTRRMFRLTEDSVRLWAQRVPEYVAAVGQG